MSNFDTEHGKYCRFCHPNGFRFDTIGVKENTAELVMYGQSFATMSERIPQEERFKYCPVCGRCLEDVDFYEAYDTLKELQESKLINSKARRALEFAINIIQKFAQSSN